MSWLREFPWGTIGRVELLTSSVGVVLPAVDLLLCEDKREGLPALVAPLDSAKLDVLGAGWFLVGHADVE